MAEITAQQLAALLGNINTIAQNAGGGNTGAGQVVQGHESHPGMLGPMKNCLWGSVRSKRKKLFEDWLEDAELRMKITKVTDNLQLKMHQASNNLTEILFQNNQIDIYKSE